MLDKEAPKAKIRPEPKKKGKFLFTLKDLFCKKMYFVKNHLPH